MAGKTPAKKPTTYKHAILGPAPKSVAGKLLHGAAMSLLDQAKRDIETHKAKLKAADKTKPQPKAKPQPSEVVGKVKPTVEKPKEEKAKETLNPEPKAPQANNASATEVRTPPVHPTQRPTSTSSATFTTSYMPPNISFGAASKPKTAKPTGGVPKDTTVNPNEPLKIENLKFGDRLYHDSEGKWPHHKGEVEYIHTFDNGRPLVQTMEADPETGKRKSFPVEIKNLRVKV